MGGRPSRGTSKDMRLKANNPNTGSKSSKQQSKPMQNQPSTQKKEGK